MKTILNIRHGFALMLVLIMGFGITSCVDNNDDDLPIHNFETGKKFITIAQAKAMYDEELAKSDYKTRTPVEIICNVSIKGIITTDDNLNGNLYKEAYIQDATGGLLMKLNTTGALNIGDSVIVNLYELYLGDYGNFVQLGTKPYTDNSGNVRVGNIDVDECMNRYSFLNPTVPQEVTLSQLKSNLDKYLGCLVKLDGVQFADSELGKTYAVAAKDGEDADYGNRNLQDAFKNTIVVRSSGYATFADDLLPEGSGSIVGIVTKFNSTIQFIIRDINEVKLDSERLSAGTGSIIFSEKFETGIGNFKTFSIKGSQAWNHDAKSKYMKISGNQSGSNHENEDWLVSPQISLSGVSNAKLTFDHTGKVFNAPLTDMTVWVSTNFDGSDVTTANWTKVDIPTYMSGNDWVFVNSGEISLSEFNNEAKIFIAFKYISTDALAATWEIKNVEVKK